MCEVLDKFIALIILYNKPEVIKVTGKVITHLMLSIVS